MKEKCSELIERIDKYISLLNKLEKKLEEFIKEDFEEKEEKKTHYVFRFLYEDGLTGRVSYFSNIKEISVELVEKFHKDIYIPGIVKLVSIEILGDKNV